MMCIIIPKIVVEIFLWLTFIYGYLFIIGTIGIFIEPKPSLIHMYETWINQLSQNKITIWFICSMMCALWFFVVGVVVFFDLYLQIILSIIPCVVFI